MRVEVLMPKWGMTMLEGILVKWLVSAGDRVAEGESLAIVETEKVDADVPSPSAGTVVNLIPQEGASVAVGSVIAYIEQ